MTLRVHYRRYEFNYVVLLQGVFTFLYVASGVFDQLTLVVQRHFVKGGERALVLAELESTHMKETQSNFDQGGVGKYIFEQSVVEKYIINRLV